VQEERKEVEVTEYASKDPSGQGSSLPTESNEKQRLQPRMTFHKRQKSKEEQGVEETEPQGTIATESNE